ncbi:Crp/Fnr family transcriptional regulator [Candidatus Chloroploca asiatica]|uniref:Cyclic nucleotide-binding protein n=1 Tax=Candidatus Chloroploca asiatica TaxID=1506545 RepID=A0A2H3KK77_9CHLR|nr:Crp/Fnr family transcriptional regulator [Candidatus Chloroploca asiatica]PDV98339.1 cyclic nucleotide-binding protein [Candidatus Chloroploca asiatica]
MDALMGNAPVQHVLQTTVERLGNVQGFRRHSYVYTPGQPAHALYFVQSGQVSLQLLSNEGRVLTLKVVEPGQFFGHSALEGSGAYDTYAQALLPVRVVAVQSTTLREAVATTPGLASALIDMLGQHRLAVSRRIDEVAFKSVPARLASVLLEMSGDQPESNQPRQRVPRRTHQQLAEMINAYRETVTKVINQFRDAHLLDIDRSGITLLNLSRLRELSQS